MAIVTVQGANQSTVSLAYDNDANALLAQYVAGVIKAGLVGGTVVAADSNAGPPPPVHPGKTGEFVQSTTGVTVLPPAYTYVVDSAPTAVIFGSGTPGEAILAGAGNLTFYATGGSGSVIGGGGNDLISIPTSDAGGWNIALGNGDDSIRALGAGNDTISLGTGHNVIQLGAGHDFITSAGSDTILAGTGSETVVASGSEVIYANGSKQLDFVGGGGTGATIYGGTGSETATGGSGNDLMFGGSAGNNFLQAGNGAATLFGGGNGDQLYAGGAAAQALHAAGGNETLFGGFASGNDTFYGGSGSTQIFTSTGNNTVVAGSGAATVAATGANNVFDFIHGQAGGTELVQFLTDASQVHISLTGYASNEAKHALAGQSSSGGSVTIQLSDNTTVTFQNIGSLTASNFT